MEAANMASSNNSLDLATTDSSSTTGPLSGLELNPAILLNPRAFPAPSAQPQSRAAKKDGPDKPMNGQENPAPVEFSFSSPSDGIAPVESSDAPSSRLNGRDGTTPNGFGNMIERMNNVQDRSHAPQQKRRKLEDGNGVDAKQRFTSGSNGMISQHIKEKRQKTGQNSTMGPAATVDLTTVDLTAGGDSDTVQAPKDEEICYGLLQASLNCHIVPSPKAGAVSMFPGHWPLVKIVLRRMQGDASHTITAYDWTRKIIGNVDSSTAAGLTALLDSPRLQLRTDSKLPSRQKKPGEVVGQATSASYKLDVTLYGPRKNAKTVGRHLLQKGIQLRAPPRVDPGIKYENPQLLEAPKQLQPAVKERAMGVPMMQTTRTVEEVRSEVMGVFDSLTKNEDLPEMEPSPIIQTELLKHQKQGLFFMTQKEQPRQLSKDGKTANSFWQIRLSTSGQKIYHNVITGHSMREPPPETFGGILADMMGLGKTLSILSLVAASLDEANDWFQAPPVQPQSPAPPRKNGTSSRSFNVPTPKSLDLTALRLNGKATLLICPLSTITNWEEQIRAHIKPGSLKYYIYHGSNRIKEAKKLAEFDLVMTTYGSVSSEVMARNKGRAGAFPLEEIGWFRIVLDEAHMIREQSTLQFKAICRLQANRRWAVTGTPVQNKLDDLAALLAFLRLTPFNDKAKFVQYITAPFKVCDPSVVPKLRLLVDSITLRRLKDKIDLPPRTDEIVKLDFSPDERRLYALFEKQAESKVQILTAGRDRIIGGKTYFTILQAISRLRLVSAHGKDLLNDTDLELVQGMTKESAIDLESDGDEEKPALAESRAYEAYSLMQETSADVCVLCQKRLGTNDAADVDSEGPDDIIGYMTACFHLICPSCISNWNDEVGNQDSGPCPVCHAHVRYTCNDIRKSKAEVEHEGHRQTKVSGKVRSRDVYAGYNGPHTKTRALVEDLLKSEAQSEAHPDEPPFKSVVFSTWTSHLDLIEIALDKARIRYTRLDGKLSRAARTAAMDSFREDRSIRVILVSITAGGLGLNLTSGNSVYVMEPLYNPAMEAQAIDRVHRLGQKRPVRTVRYVMRDSIEEKMVALQQKKLKLASLSMDRQDTMDKTEAAKQKLEDLRSLFR
ncbi:SNF2 family N-terminal domain-containing protein [Xylariomycetidae sp. FL2044]|nr:SNF2 family N-terminal domain-containing protein [Xylariomycetidae sp. FL2044]